MKNPLITIGALAVLSSPLMAQSANIRHYWDFETDFSDSVGSVTGTAGTDVTTTTGHDGNTAAFFPTAISGGGSFNADGYVALDPNIQKIGDGSGPFSFSYWVRLDYDATTNPRGIFDFSSVASTTADGPQSLYIQAGTNSGKMAFRVDGNGAGNTGNAVAFADVSAFEGTSGTPEGQWFFVAATFDPSSNLSVYLNGNPTPAATVDATAVGTVNWQTGADQYFGAFNVGGPTNRGTEGGVDDLAIYQGLLTTDQIAALHTGTLSPTDINTAPTPVGHYWDMDTLHPATSLPIDRGNGLATSQNGVVNLAIDGDYGEAYPGANQSLNLALAGADYLVAETFDEAPTGLDFGSGSFAISYLAFDHSDPALGDNDLRGIPALDCLAGTETGFQISSDTVGNFIFRLDDDVGNEIRSIDQPGFETLAMPANQWVCVVINVDRDADEVEIFFNGSSQGTYSISNLAGNITCSQDLQIGVINGGGSASLAQKGGLDDVAIYPGILTAQQVTDLCTQTVTPIDLLATFQPGTTIPVVSVDYNDTSDEFTVVFSSVNGSTYSVYGGPNPQDRDTWPELSTTGLLGDGSDLSFSHAPAGAPPTFFFEIRED